MEDRAETSKDREERMTLLTGWPLLFLILLAAAAIGGGLLVAWHYDAARQRILGAIRTIVDWTESLGPVGAVVLAAAFAAGCVLFIPASIFNIAAGFAFGFIGGLLSAALGSAAGAAAAFALGRTAARPWVERWISGSRRFRLLDEGVRREGFKIVLLSRLSPIMPFDLINYAFGLTPVPFRVYITASVIGVLPATALYVFIGTLAREMAMATAGEDDVAPLGTLILVSGAILTLALVIVLGRIARGALREAAREAKVPKD